MEKVNVGYSHMATEIASFNRSTETLPRHILQAGHNPRQLSRLTNPISQPPITVKSTGSFLVS